MAFARRRSTRDGTIRAGGAGFAAYRLSRRRAPAGAAELIWAHGWGHTYQALLPPAQAMRPLADSWLIDLPGFGASPVPPAAWGTEDYADAMAEWDCRDPAGGRKRRTWVGHSFGCRVGLQLAARHPRAVEALFLIAAAGLPPHRSLAARDRSTPRIAPRSGVLRALTPEGPKRAT